jgi:hypothetical protein
MSILHTWIAENSDKGRKLEVIFDLIGQPIEHLERTFKRRVLLALLITVYV